MTEQDKAREEARLLLAWADGKALQMFLGVGKWDDYVGIVAPKIHDPSFWRVKPEPRRAWSTDSYITSDSSVAQKWRNAGRTVTEWQEVLP